LEQQRSIEAELEKIDNETRREVEQGLRHERAVSDIISQSEPTSPPSEAADVVPSEFHATQLHIRTWTLTLKLKM